MKKFTSKSFSSKKELIKKGFVQGLSNPVGIASLGVSATALATTRSNYKMQKARIKGKKIFSEKSFGLASEGLLRGALLGTGLTTSLILPLSKAGMNGTPRAKAATILVGAALGAICGSIWGITKTVGTKLSQLNTGHELIEEVIKNFKRAGYKRDKDWTTDAKVANLMKTKVCIVVSRRADELGVLVNMVNDERLKQVSEEIVKNLPAQKQKTEKVSDKFNDLQITSFPDSNDPVFVFSVAERFIKRGFPVYIMEVG